MEKKVGRAQYEDSVKSNIKWYERKLADSKIVPMEAITEAFPQGDWTVGGINAAEYDLPLDFALIETVKHWMAEFFPQFVLKEERQHVWNYTHTGPEAGRFLEYGIRQSREEYVESLFSIGFRSTMKGSTCVIQPLGTTSEPVFEVVCPAGAQEGYGETQDQP